MVRYGKRWKGNTKGGDDGCEEKLKQVNRTFHEERRKERGREDNVRGYVWCAKVWEGGRKGGRWMERWRGGKEVVKREEGNKNDKRW